MPTEPILIDLPDELLGERVIVRHYRAGEGAALFGAVEESRAHLRPWMPWADEHQSAEDTEAMVRRWHADWIRREDLAVGIWERSTGRYLGASGLHRIKWTVRSFEIGYWVRASEEGKGYITEAVRLLLGMAFDLLEARRVYIRCATDNVRSQVVPLRLGFVHEGTLRNDIRGSEGQSSDVHMYGMTRTDWDRLCGA